MRYQGTNRFLPSYLELINIYCILTQWLGKGSLISKLIATLDYPKEDSEVETFIIAKNTLFMFDYLHTYKASIHAAEILKELIEVATWHIPRQLAPPKLLQEILSEFAIAELVPYVLEQVTHYLLPGC